MKTALRWALDHTPILSPKQRALRVLTTPVSSRQEALWAIENALESAMRSAAHTALIMALRNSKCEECIQRVRGLLYSPTGGRRGVPLNRRRKPPRE